MSWVDHTHAFADKFKRESTEKETKVLYLDQLQFDSGGPAESAKAPRALG